MTIVHHETPPTGSDSEPRYIEIRGMPVLSDSGPVEEVIIVRRDVTLERVARRSLQEQSEQLERLVVERNRELLESNEALQLQRDQLAEANDRLIDLQALKEDLTNMVVHDLKGPLAEIQANLEMLDQVAESDLQSEFVESARMGADDLLRMITNLLDVSRMEERRLTLNYESFDLHQTIVGSVRRFTPLARLQEVILTASPPPEAPLLYGDQRLFERIFNNLISNALNHTSAEGRVTASVEFEQNRFLLCVEDSGVGIPKEYQEEIFEKFSQGRKAVSKTSTGLGLTFCKMAVEAHGGRIWVESEPGQGSRFFISVPPRTADDLEG